MAAVKYDIDYRVTFPSNNLLEENCVEYGPSVNEKKEPVVILLGWAGCKDHHLAKYSSIYEKRCITISYTAPNRDVFFRSNNLCHAAEKLLEIIMDLDLKAHPIFVHSFSNGGGTVYCWISEIIHSRAEFKQIWLAGSIFDSSPGRRRITSGMRAILAASKQSTFIKFFTVLVFIHLYVLQFVKLRVKRILHLAANESSLWDDLENDKSTCPQLYLYSRADDIISYLDIEEMTASRKQHGVDVQRICWDDSGHVAHLVKHREPYIKACLDFIDYCVERKLKQDVTSELITA